ncbi:viroplasmin family protein [Erysipelothrix rhusiopathiae]|nr:viroplasmin family protein [Erysipelothrix rhusiopathiae]MDE8203860.1 viroplasmin family protein [Erysipelothrix rhusiopathiae]MDE8258472.1 viroplasmin family protein [Erysipelothrix rhusiopathiae]MDE8272358.1 viroplasmin family protein [Erysipelothrix rhusiopathiae]MDE8301484.1 viroplasmin family protein [Erysipelothrix rhusiopathiae]
MAKKTKYYAVRKGHNPGVYEDYEEVKKQILGYSGAEHKGFKTYEEALAFMSEEGDKIENDLLTNNQIDDLVSKFQNEGRLVAFTDGSFKSDIASYGCYILEPSGGKSVEISDIIHTEKFKGSRNIGAEIMGVISVFDWALSTGYEKIAIFYDYKGIGKWADSEWKADSKISIWFKEKLEKKYNDLLDVVYIKVPAHSGIIYNEEADRLATEARNRNTKPIYKMSDSYFTCQSVGLVDFKHILDNMLLLEHVECIKESEMGNELMYRFKHNKDNLTIKFYKNSSKVLAQGKPTLLFSAFLSLYTEKVSDSELINLYRNMYRNNFSKDQIDEEIEKLNVPQDYPKDVITLIKQATMEKIAISLNKEDRIYDYCGYVFSACRALEGHIKYLFEKENVHIGKKSNGKYKTIGEYFTVDSNGVAHVSNKEAQTWKSIEKINKSYEIYLIHRHRLGHFGELMSFDHSESDSFMIDNKQTAIDMIQEILDVISF